MALYALNPCKSPDCRNHAQAVGCTVANESSITGEEDFTDFRTLLELPYEAADEGEELLTLDRKCTLADLGGVL